MLDLFTLTSSVQNPTVVSIIYSLCLAYVLSTLVAITYPLIPVFAKSSSPISLISCEASIFKMSLMCRYYENRSKQNKIL